MRPRRRAVALFAACVVGVFAVSCAFVSMPGKNHSGPLAALDDEQLTLSAALRDDVAKLAEIGERNGMASRQLDDALAFVDTRFAALGYAVEHQQFFIDGYEAGFTNVTAERAGTSRKDEIVIIGAHYDTAPGTPGANDNASGVAVLFALAAEAQRGPPPARTLRFVAFTNEEPPFFDTNDMGSRRYAARVKARNENVVAMISLETLGCYSDVEGSQEYPFPFGLLYPSTGNFVGFVSDLSSVALTRSTVESFRAHAAFPSEGVAAPGFIPGIYWSDHASFWGIGVPAVMVTDTAPFRYHSYHESGDTAEKVDVERLARVTVGLQGVVTDLATP